MHIKIENDNNEVEAVLCVERGHSYARILYCEPEHLRSLVNIARDLGALMIMIEADPDDVEQLADEGFESIEFFVPMRKVLRETKSKRS